MENQKKKAKTFSRAVTRKLVVLSQLMSWRFANAHIYVKLYFKRNSWIILVNVQGGIPYQIELTIISSTCIIYSSHPSVKKFLIHVTENRWVTNKNPFIRRYCELDVEYAFFLLFVCLPLYFILFRTFSEFFNIFIELIEGKYSNYYKKIESFYLNIYRSYLALLAKIISNFLKRLGTSWRAVSWRDEIFITPTD